MPQARPRDCSPSSSARPLRCFIVLMVMVLVRPGLAELIEDVKFVERDGRPLHLDLALPDDGETLRPAILCIHGGGWRAGSRKSFHGRMQQLSKAGYVAASTEYRFTDVAPWPAQLDDVQAALQFMIDHADEYGIDTQRIGVMGGSAGGHLSLMLGCLPNEHDSPHKLRCIVNYFGPAEFRDIPRIQHARNLVEPLVDGKLEERRQTLADISPVVVVDRTDPPVLTLHGTEDRLVPFEQAEFLHASLNWSQVPNELFPMVGAAHGIGGDVAKGQAKVDQFLRDYLQPSDMPLVLAEDFDEDARVWQPTDATAWRRVNAAGRSFYSLTKKRSDYTPEVRSPLNYSLLPKVDVGDFVLDVDMRSTHPRYGHQDLCLFFGFRDASHFYYVHFGREADAHANSIFLVNGKPRVSIATERTDGTDWSEGWHHVRIRRQSLNGTIEVYFDDMQTPIMKAVDKTFTHGAIGVGSFDDTGDFDSIRLWSNAP